MADLVFPSGEAKSLRNFPQKRFALAVNYLPLPGAFREAAKGLRQLVRDHRKAGEEYETVLLDLYRLACLRELVFGLLPGTGYAWRDAIPRELWIAFSFDYQRIGVEGLELLGATDLKWIQEAWGTPNAHDNVAAVHPDLAAEVREFLSASAARSEGDVQERLPKVAVISQAGKDTGKGCLIALVLGPWHLFSWLLRGGG